MSKTQHTNDNVENDIEDDSKSVAKEERSEERIDSKTAKERSEMLGVSVYHLNHVLLPLAEDLLQRNDGNVYDINEPIIKEIGKEKICPRDGKVGAAYVDCLEGEDHVGNATFMVSYAWAYKLEILWRVVKS
ncbi:hypothetical protein CTEN210_06207 [Chaetoceros tenuissimus]|uniref:Uncharacterized protein n=1 Tax=Chaetoceros tenuissimus TaxID=426638 RepID=A0AAD3CR99_9STRA|nr:hypothetical protein CTEN210_06207 [Chaetoceros tenuissimus]